MRKPITQDTVSQAIRSDWKTEDPTHIGQIDTELLATVYDDLNRKLHPFPEHQVFVANEEGGMYNQVHLRKPAPGLYQNKSDEPDLIIDKENLSPALMSGAVLLAVHLPVHNLLQVDMEHCEKRGYAGVRRLTRHMHMGKEHHLILRRLGDLYRQRSERSKERGDKGEGLMSDRQGTDAARSVGEDEIKEFRAVLADDPDRVYSLTASLAAEDRQHYGFPPHIEHSAGVTAMLLLEDQSGYFPLYDALECVNGLGFKDPPIIVEALRADGSVHSRWEFTAFEFDQGVLKDGESYPTYYLGEKKEIEQDAGSQERPEPSSWER